MIVPDLIFNISLALFIGLHFGGLAGTLVPRLAALEPSTKLLPTLRQLCFPGSHCSCGYNLSLLDIQPVIGWLKSSGRCRSCGRRVPPLYPLMEVSVGLFFLALATASLGQSFETFSLLALPAITSLYIATLLAKLRPTGSAVFTLAAVAFAVLASPAIVDAVVGAGITGVFLVTRYFLPRHPVFLSLAIVGAASILPGGAFNAIIVAIGIFGAQCLYDRFAISDPAFIQKAV